MPQRRMNIWATASDRATKRLEVLSHVHTSGIGAFGIYTFSGECLMDYREYDNAGIC